MVVDFGNFDKNMVIRLLNCVAYPGRDPDLIRLKIFTAELRWPFLAKISSMLCPHLEFHPLIVKIRRNYCKFCSINYQRTKNIH